MALQIVKKESKKDASNSDKHIRISYDLLYNSGLNTSEIGLVLMLSTFADNETRISFPSIDTLVKLGLLSKKTILKALNSLEK